MVRIVGVMATIGLTMWGCVAQPSNPPYTPIEVKVPIATPVYCQVANLAKPELPIAVLKSDSPPADTIRAYAATVAILKGAVRERDAELAGCVVPANDSKQTASPGSEGTDPSSGQLQ